MKNKALFILLLLLLAFCTVQAQESAVWEDYIKAHKKGKEAILPNFSYAGYKYSEVGIPDVDYKVFDVTKYGCKLPQKPNCL